MADAKDIARTAWIKDVVGVVVESAEHVTHAEKHEEGLEAINKALMFERDAIREAFESVEVEVKTTMGKKKMKLLDAGGDYMHEIDTVHHTKKMTEAIDEPTMRLLEAQIDKITAVEATLKENPYYNPPEPDWAKLPDGDPDQMDPAAREKFFDDMSAALALREKQQRDYVAAQREAEQAIAKDLWQPLVREGVIPENMVPQKHSAVAEQFGEASALYDERLQEYSRDLTEKDLLKEKFALGFKIANSTLKLATAGAGVVGAAGELAGDKDLALSVTEATEIMGHLGTALAITEGLTMAVLTDKDFTAVSDVIAATVGDIVSAEAGDEIGNIVSTSISVAARGARVGQLCAKGQYDEAINTLGDAIASGCSGFDKEEGGGHVSAIGAGIKEGLARLVQAKQYSERIRNGESPKAILGELVDEASKIAADAAGGPAAKIKEEYDSWSADTADDRAALKEANAFIADKFDMNDLRARREEAAKNMVEDIEALQQADDEDFRLALVAGFSMATDDDDAINEAESNRIASIEYILAVQAKNDATFNLCKTIATKGTGMVMKMFPGAALVEACLSLTFAIQDAVKKAEEMIIWMDNVADAQNASSAQVDAMLNRKGLQKKQTIQANVQVALDAAKVVAEVLALTPAAPAAPIVKKSVEFTEAAIEAADLIYTEVQLARAWKIYQAAAANPADRYLARKATRENPTLSKYAMAWGAKEGDPIAVEGMRRCGLNEHTLALPDTNVTKVVSYLEAKYADDPVLLRAVPVKEEWHPGTVELTFRSWASFYQMATTKAAPLVGTTQDVSGINAALGALDTAEAAFKDAVDAAFEANKTREKEEVELDPGGPDKGAVLMIKAALLKTSDALRKYKALDADGAEHKEMATYVDALVALTEARMTGLDKVMEDAKWAQVWKAAA